MIFPVFQAQWSTRAGPQLAVQKFGRPTDALSSRTSYFLPRAYRGWFHAQTITSRMVGQGQDQHARLTMNDQLAMLLPSIAFLGLVKATVQLTFTTYLLSVNGGRLPETPSFWMRSRTLLCVVSTPQGASFILFSVFYCSCASRCPHLPVTLLRYSPALVHTSLTRELLSLRFVCP